MSTETASPANSRSRVGELLQWINLRAVSRDHDVAHQNWRDARRLAGRGDDAQAEDEVIQVDSPTTVNHYQLSGGLGAVGKLVAAGVIASGLGVPIGLGLAAPAIVDALRPSPSPATAPVESPPADDWWFDLYVGPPQESE